MQLVISLIIFVIAIVYFARKSSPKKDVAGTFCLMPTDKYTPENGVNETLLPKTLEFSVTNNSEERITLSKNVILKYGAKSAKLPIKSSRDIVLFPKKTFSSSVDVPSGETRKSVSNTPYEKIGAYIECISGGKIILKRTMNYYLSFEDQDKDKE